MYVLICHFNYVCINMLFYVFFEYVCIYIPNTNKHIHTWDMCTYMGYIKYIRTLYVHIYIYTPLALHVKGSCPAPARQEDFQLFSAPVM